MSAPNATVVQPIVVKTSRHCTENTTNMTSWVHPSPLGSVAGFEVNLT